MSYNNHAKKENSSAILIFGRGITKGITRLFERRLRRI
jgi:hypothetical protein